MIRNMMIVTLTLGASAFGQQTQAPQTNCEDIRKQLSTYSKSDRIQDIGGVVATGAADIAAQHTRNGYGWSQVGNVASQVTWARTQQKQQHDWTVEQMYWACKQAESQRDYNQTWAGVEHHRIDSQERTENSRIAADKENRNNEVAAQVYHDTVVYDRTADVVVNNGAISTSNLLSRQDQLNAAAIAKWRAAQK